MTTEQLINLDNQTLVEAFHILFGVDFKRTFPDNYKVAEMRSIFNDGTQPCVPFTNWVKCIEFLSSKLS
jgi:hypothetical protein